MRRNNHRANHRANRRRPGHAAAAALSLLLACAPAQAADPTPAATPAADPACDAPAFLAQDPDRLSAALPRCEKNPTYLYHLGWQRNQQQRYEQAADHLERALLLAPDQPATLLQYAIALAGSGDLHSAIHLMTALRQRSDLPAPLRASLHHLLATWAPRLLAPPADGPIWGPQADPSPRSATLLTASLRLGYDNNLQGASRQSSLTLTLPGQHITLPLEPDQLPRAGIWQQADLRASHQRQQPGGSRWGLQAALQQRNTPSYRTTTSSQAEIQLDYTLAPVWQWEAASKTIATPGQPPARTSLAPWASLGLTALHTQGGTRYAGRNLALGLEWAASACVLRAALDSQQRQLHSTPILSGRYLGASLQWQCQASSARQWLAALRAGRDQAQDPGRPGGNQAQYGARLQLATPAPSLPGRPGAQWLLEADYSHQRDTQGYSPLLQDNRRRQQQRLSARIEWQQPLWPGLHTFIAGEAVAQNANLTLFQMRSQGLWLGLRGQW